MARSLRRRAARFEVLSLLVASIAVPSLAVGRARFSWGASPDTTNARNRWLGVVAVAALLTAAAARPIGAQDANPRYTNLQVLPSDISDAELGQIMLDNLSGLGLPRRAGEGCLYCHAGSLDVPRNEWDYASDEKPAKEKARVMMAMVREINEGYLSRLGDRSDPEVEVGCYTCHAARLNPVPLVGLLLAEHRDGGVDALARTYRAVRARYYEADAYDFRVSSLVNVANRLVEAGAFDDAGAVHELNVEYHDGPAARAGLVRLRLVQALEADGTDAMIARYRELKDEQPPEAFHPLTVDPLAWSLYRAGREAPALALFELNVREHPDAFTSNESLAYAVSSSGDPARGLRIARAWMAEYPEHEAGRQLLTELQRPRR